MVELDDLFVRWNQVLYLYFFGDRDYDDNENEVSLFIDKETIEELGQKNGLGGYDSFLNIVLLSLPDRKSLYVKIIKRFIGSINLSKEEKKLLNCSNLFEFATLFMDERLYDKMGCPFLAYIVFSVLMGNECYKENRSDIGNYITKKLRERFPRHNNNRQGLEELFFELSEIHPRFYAETLTKQPYIGLIRYQLGLSKVQEEALKKAMYDADLSEDLPYDLWIYKIVDYVDQSMKDLLKKTIKGENKKWALKGDDKDIYIALKRRISNIRANFDPNVYEEKHKNEKVHSKGRFVLAVYEDDFSEDNDHLVLLTDVNNKDISDNNLKILKGSIDRLGEYAEYNTNHVIIDGKDNAEMKSYSLRTNEDEVTSVQLGGVVTFTRCSSNYLIQTPYPQKGKQTYILVKKNHEDEWKKWMHNYGNPSVKAEPNKERVLQIFGKGWDMYSSNEVEHTGRSQISNGNSISKEGGIKCIGKNNVYLITALPYFEFPEPIDINRIKVYINIDNKVLEESRFVCKIVDQTKLVVDLIGIKDSDHSQEIGITLEYKNLKGKTLTCHEEFSVSRQDVKFDEKKLYKIDMWGGQHTNENSPYLRGIKVYNVESVKMTGGTGLYQNTNKSDFNIYDRRFYLVNLITAECSMREGFSITDSRLKKCIRYAATRFDIDVYSEFTSIKYLLLNSGYINADFDNGKIQPIPPTFLQTAVGTCYGENLFMLAGSYTQKFLYDLKSYCQTNNISIFLHSINNNEISKCDVLIPPVILLDHSFKPDDFKKSTNSVFQYFEDEDIAMSLLKAIPSYVDYENTLSYIEPSVFRTQLNNPDTSGLPRIRTSRNIGYNTLRWIEKKEGEFDQITIPDIAWANLYCLIKKHSYICTKDVDKLLFPTNLHLPVMMQRVLFTLNFGIPQKEKVFICNIEDQTNVYYNYIKRYRIKDTPENSRISSAIYTISGKEDNEKNDAVRHRCNSSNFKLFFWKNLEKSSEYPRSLLVLTDYKGDIEYAFGIRKPGKTNPNFDIFLRCAFLDSDFVKIDNKNINEIYSRIINNYTKYKLEHTLENKDTLLKYFGLNFNDNSIKRLPPKDNYQIEEIKII